MRDQHYNEKLSAFVNHELPTDERQTVAEHLLLCAACRREHDEIKFGATLAARLPQTDAPQTLWQKIENQLDEKTEAHILLPFFAFFNLRVGLASLALIGVLLTTLYFVFRQPDSTETAKSEASVPNSNKIVPPNVSAMPEILQTPDTKDSNQTIKSNSAVQQPPNPDLETTPEKLPNNPNASETLTQNTPSQTKNIQTERLSWNVEILAGAPKIGNFIKGEKLFVGEFIETDSASRARVEVADIGNVEVAPNSRVQLVNSKTTEHRLSLERGLISAKILAPPRLFIVDTPSAVAVDLGCEYTLEVDREGNSRLHVTSGFVALERGGRESIVPAGAVALTKKGQGLGTPFAANSTESFRNALYQFDFEKGDRAALQKILREATFYDIISLWHLLERAPKNDREKIFDALAGFVKPPADVTRRGILELDQKMLKAWWTKVENAWFE